MNRRDRSRRTANVCAPHESPPSEALIAALRTLARLLAPLVREELASDAGEDWIDQHRSPLGRRRHCELARNGAFPARKHGRRWLARRKDVDAYIEAQRGAARLDARPADGSSSADQEQDDPAVIAVLAEAGLELVAGARARKGSR